MLPNKVQTICRVAVKRVPAFHYRNRRKGKKIRKSDRDNPIEQPTRLQALPATPDSIPGFTLNLASARCHFVSCAASNKI